MVYDKMETNYKELLKRAYSQLPPKVFDYRRFELPTARSSIAGAQTILHNYREICDRLNRDPSFLLKFLSKELATAGSMDGTRAFFQGRFDRTTLNRLIKKFAEEFVICSICKRPDVGDYPNVV